MHASAEALCHRDQPRPWTSSAHRVCAVLAVWPSELYLCCHCFLWSSVL